MQVCEPNLAFARAMQMVRIVNAVQGVADTAPYRLGRGVRCHDRCDGVVQRFRLHAADRPGAALAAGGLLWLKRSRSLQLAPKAQPLDVEDRLGEAAYAGGQPQKAPS